jgi:uncharacterized protein (UPF0335 family)
MMDFTISLVTVTDDDFKRYVEAIEKSDLDKFIKGELKDLLKTARTQTKEAKKMGWIYEGDFPRG